MEIISNYIINGNQRLTVRQGDKHFGVSVFSKFFDTQVRLETSHIDFASKFRGTFLLIVGVGPIGLVKDEHRKDEHGKLSTGMMSDRKGEHQLYEHVPQLT